MSRQALRQVKPLTVAVLLSGRGSNFRALRDAIIRYNLPVRICVVLSDKVDAAGLCYAREQNIPVEIVERRPKERTNETFNDEMIAVLQKYSPDLIVLAGFMRIVHANFVAAFRNRIINIHPSLLPHFRGLNAQRQALLAGVDETGCTVHLVNEDLDDGPALAQARVPVLADDTEESLSTRILAEEHKILPAVVLALASCKITIGADGMPSGTEPDLSIRSIEIQLRDIDLTEERKR